MRSFQVGLLFAFSLIALVGCGEIVDSNAAVVVERGDTSKVNDDLSDSSDRQSSETETQLQDDDADTGSKVGDAESASTAEQKQKPVDVREVGPSTPPQNPVAPSADSSKSDVAQGANETQDDTAVPESTLRDIKPPTEEEPVQEYVETQTIEIPKNWTRITPVGKEEVWVDLKAKQVMVAGMTCLDRGGLEMFICPLHTKEHESVIAVNSQSHQIHAALIAIGVNPGKPVQWHPEYKAATGPVIEIDVMWKDPDSGRVEVTNAQNMIRNFRTKKLLDSNWVFGGSVTETDEKSGQTYYYADGGELVCLSNFSTAMMDLPIESSDSNNDLLYEANPESIPTPGTKVYVIFKPKLENTSETKQVTEKEED